MVFIEYNNNQRCLKSTVNIDKNAMYHIGTTTSYIENNIKTIKVR